MANPFAVAVPSPIEALMQGEAGYKGMRDLMLERERTAATREAQNIFASGGNANSAIARLIGVSDPKTALTFLQTQQQQKLQKEASDEFARTMGGVFGVGTSPSSPAAATPTGMPSPAVTRPAPAAPVPSTSRVWGDQEAKAAGLYDPSPAAAPSPVASAQPAPRPEPVTPTPSIGPLGAASGATINGVPIATALPGLIKAATDPRLSQSQRDIAKGFLMKAVESNPEIQKLEIFQRRPDLLKIAMDLKTAGATKVSVGEKGETKFEEEFGKKQADRWNGYLTNAEAARRKMVDINTMREISSRLGTQGATAGIKEAIGPYAEALGINLDGLSDIQAYTQIIQRLAPQQRAVGSGSTSDIEFKGFLKSLPGLAQNPVAREVGLNTMEALARDEIARGEIAARLATGEIKRADAERELRALPDPMRGFAEWRKANPQLYGQAIKNQPPAPSGPVGGPLRRPAPAVGAVEGGYRFRGGDPASPQSWERVQ